MIGQLRRPDVRPLTLSANINFMSQRNAELPCTLPATATNELSKLRFPFSFLVLVFVSKTSKRKIIVRSRALS